MKLTKINQFKIMYQSISKTYPLGPWQGCVTLILSIFYILYFTISRLIMQ